MCSGSFRISKWCQLKKNNIYRRIAYCSSILYANHDYNNNNNRKRYKKLGFTNFRALWINTMNVYINTLHMVDLIPFIYVWNENALRQKRERKIHQLEIDKRQSKEFWMKKHKKELANVYKKLREAAKTMQKLNKRMRKMLVWKLCGPVTMIPWYIVNEYHLTTCFTYVNNSLYSWYPLNSLHNVMQSMLHSSFFVFFVSSTGWCV